jgi:hypothetical protein
MNTFEPASAFFPHRTFLRTGYVLFGFGWALLATPSCSSDSPATPDGGGAGSATTGAGLCASVVMGSDIDNHCNSDDGGVINQEATTCPSTAGDASQESGDGGDEYPQAHNGTFAADDDCKYDVTYGVSCDNSGSTFTVHVKGRATGMPVTGANPSIEAFLTDTHPLPSLPGPATELGNGDYKISGVQFDMDGIWTIRFHFFESCLETEETTKHSHVAFSVNVQKQP